MRRSLFHILVFATLFSACTVDSGGELSFDCDSFDHKVVSRNEAEVFVSDSSLLGRPTAMRIHPDGFLVVIDYVAKQQVVFFDLKDGGAHDLITRGRGPMELITAWDIGIYDGDVWVSGPQESKMVRLSLDRNTRKFDMAEEIDLSATPFMRSLPYINSGFLIMSQGSSGRRMEIISDKGESIKEVGSFPDVKMSGDYKPNNFWLQSVLSISPDKNHTAVCYSSIDYIDIYDRKMGLKKRLRGPIGSEPEFFEQKIAAGTRFIQDPSLIVYKYSASNDMGFWVSYVGFERKPGVRPEAGETDAYKIFSFDWSGKPLKCYTFEHPVWCFDVDATGKKMYVSTRHPETLEPEILIYDL